MWDFISLTLSEDVRTESGEAATSSENWGQKHPTVEEENVPLSPRHLAILVRQVVLEVAFNQDWFPHAVASCCRGCRVEFTGAAGEGLQAAEDFIHPEV